MCLYTLKIAMQSHFRNLSTKLSTAMLFYLHITGPCQIYSGHFCRNSNVMLLSHKYKISFKKLFYISTYNKCPIIKLSMLFIHEMWFSFSFLSACSFCNFNTCQTWATRWLKRGGKNNGVGVQYATIHSSYNSSISKN